MAYSDSEPELIGRKVFLLTVIAAIAFATAAYIIVS